jgi:hypothetical protein
VSARPRLSVCGITRDSADRLDHWILRTLEFADELVLLVDNASTDATFEIASRYADTVRLVEHPPFIEWVMDWGLRQATGDWVLWLDDDELMHEGFRAAIDPVLAQRSLTHAHLQSRAVVPAAGGTHRWLRQFPWYPDPRLRLVRNVGSIFRHRGRLHSPFEVDGDGIVLDTDQTAIYHLDLLRRTRAQREEKVERYRGNNAPSCEEYYLYEDYAGSLATESFDEPAVFREPSPAAVAEGRRRSARPPVGTPPTLSLEDLRRHLAPLTPGGHPFAAAYRHHTIPPTLGANRGQVAVLTVQNTSEMAWRGGGAGTGTVTARYHWRHPEHGIVLREGDASLFPGRVQPGQEVTLPIGIWTPYAPGGYVLELDLRCEGVGWFSEHGVPPLAVPVEIHGTERVLARPRPAALAAEPAPPRMTRRSRVAARVRRGADHPLRAALRARNVVPITPVRVLDTRDGSGAPGAVLGPLAAGASVTLELTEPLGIPGHAVGVVANLSVPAATYNGFVSSSAGDGQTGRNGFVDVYFNDRGEPTINQVTLLLGPPATVGGRVSLHLSDNHPGTAQLLLDVVAYVG